MAAAGWGSTACCFSAPTQCGLETPPITTLRAAHTIPCTGRHWWVRLPASHGTPANLVGRSRNIGDCTGACQECFHIIQGGLNMLGAVHSAAVSGCQREKTVPSCLRLDAQHCLPWYHPRWLTRNVSSRPSPKQAANPMSLWVLQVQLAGRVMWSCGCVQAASSARPRCAGGQRQRARVRTYRQETGSLRAVQPLLRSSLRGAAAQPATRLPVQRGGLVQLAEQALGALLLLLQPQPHFHPVQPRRHRARWYRRGPDQGKGQRLGGGSR